MTAIPLVEYAYPLEFGRHRRRCNRTLPSATLFASNDVGTHIDRVAPDRTVHRRWAKVASPNGLAIDPTGRYLYATQTLVPSAIKRIDIADPATVTTYAQPPPWARAALLDGLTIDAAGRLYVAVNGAGQVWRVDTDGTICALARGLRFPSAVALGQGPDGFSEGNGGLGVGVGGQRTACDSGTALTSVAPTRPASASNAGVRRPRTSTATPPWESAATSD